MCQTPRAAHILAQSWDKIVHGTVPELRRRIVIVGITMSDKKKFWSFFSLFFFHFAKHKRCLLQFFLE